MKTWIAKIKDSGPWIVFFEIFVIAQLLLIFVFNLTHLKYEAGFDSSAAMAQNTRVFLGRYPVSRRALAIPSIMATAQLSSWKPS